LQRILVVLLELESLALEVVLVVVMQAVVNSLVIETDCVVVVLGLMVGGASR
jgi:hypothetical protein